ncbi:MAG: alpha-amylase family glycosyl hydrolase [Actinomycetia bacterium]|nr:alpha-amylase family glycosyl hydrolase [Actinomycetes bacterium]
MVALLLAGIMRLSGPPSATAGVAPAPLPGEVVLANEEGQRSLREPLTRERFYFVMTDRFANGDPTNDTGGVSGERTETGFDPTDKGFFNGGDLRGIIDRLDYIEGLGTTAIWLTPVFVNRPVQGPPGQESAGYHGYWITDFTQIDPHYGTNDEMAELIDAAHERGMLVFFDIITNHTADVISYEEGQYGYRSKAESPYLDADGSAFDDRDHVASADFPELDAQTSFPYTPVLAAEDAAVKVPEWLNDVTMYHNRGDSTFAGESSEYGDFFGLDDLFTERREVVDGMLEIYQTWLDFGVDGFRIDTVKHVNIEFWQEFSRGMAAHARANGKDDFFMFGEVYDGRPQVLSRYTTEGLLPSVLDFGFQSAASSWLRQGSSRDLFTLLSGDDWYIAPHANAYSLPTFLSNHDMGRIAMMTRGITNREEQWLQRVLLGHELMYFTRGQPVVYYGDEQGFVGSGGDKDARQSLFATQVEQYATEPVLGGPSGAIDRYNTEHPIYERIAALGQLREEHPALADGIQQMTFASDGPGVIAFSRIDRDTHVEYIVAANNTSQPIEVEIEALTPATGFDPVWGEHAAVTSTDEAMISLIVPGLSALVLRAQAPVPSASGPPEASFTAWGADLPMPGTDRRPVQVQVHGSAPVEVTFQRSVDGGEWELLGTDDNVPYRVWVQAGAESVQYRAVVRDLEGRSTVIESDPVSAAAGEPGLTVTAPGSFQDEIGCSEDWQPQCPHSTLTAGDEEGVYTWTTTEIPAGSWEFKIAIDHSWTENYGAGGAPDGDNVLLVVPGDGAEVTITYDSRSNAVTADVG